MPRHPKRTVLIIGAGPAGLTAAYELLRQNRELRVILAEADKQVGGLSKTVLYKGNRMDIGGHRFFSKSDKVMNWWLHFLPLEKEADNAVLTYHGQHIALPDDTGHTATHVPDPDHVMLLRRRQSRIYFLNRFFDYPLSLSWSALRQLGLWRTVRIGLSYAFRSVFPKKPEEHLEAFFINRFGDELYRTFFKAYTEKVWGIPCREISAAWGAQRVKKLSVLRALLHAIRPKKNDSYLQKDTDTSLVEQFLYPKYGPGHLWETVATAVTELGGELRLGTTAADLRHNGKNVEAVVLKDAKTKRLELVRVDFVLSTMPVQQLIEYLEPKAPDAIAAIAEALPYRAFITVGVLLTRFGGGAPIADNWLYIQDGNVQVGRIQIFNNWSPALVKDPETWWIGMEYFCDEGDALWQLEDAAMIRLAVEELERLQLAQAGDVLDHTVVRVPKTYPVYSGAYSRFDELRVYLDGFENLFLIGRNGMHKYNNQDHSMLTAMKAAGHILNGTTDKSDIWAINTEEDYHEEK